MPMVVTSAEGPRLPPPHSGGKLYKCHITNKVEHERTHQPRQASADCYVSEFEMDDHRDRASLRSWADRLVRNQLFDFCLANHCWPIALPTIEWFVYDSNWPEGGWQPYTWK